MTRSQSRRCALLVVSCLVASMHARESAAHESPVDHVDRELIAWIADGRLFLRYRARLTERMAIMDLAAADDDRDGKVSDAELKSHLTGRQRDLAKQIRLDADGKPLEWTVEGDVKLDAGLGQTFLFSVPLASIGTPQKLRLVDGYSRQYPGGFRYLSNPALPENAVRIAADLDSPADAGKSDHPTELRLILKLPGARP